MMSSFYGETAREDSRDCLKNADARTCVPALVAAQGDRADRPKAPSEPESDVLSPPRRKQHLKSGWLSPIKILCAVISLTACGHLP
jgi:hypothetical protein